jgi:hypothetical protein
MMARLCRRDASRMLGKMSETHFEDRFPRLDSSKIHSWLPA